jgi:hypothetical protein
MYLYFPQGFDSMTEVHRMFPIVICMSNDDTLEITLLVVAVVGGCWG